MQEGKRGLHPRFPTPKEPPILEFLELLLANRLCRIPGSSSVIDKIITLGILVRKYTTNYYIFRFLGLPCYFLRFYQFFINSIFNFHKFMMIATFDDSPTIKYNYSMGVSNCGQPMSYYYRSSTFGCLNN